MRKLWIYLLLLIVIVESVFCVLIVQKNKQLDISVSDGLKKNLTYIKQNIEDTLYARKSCDVNFIIGECSEFDATARVFSVAYPNDDLSDIENLVQEYEKLILDISANGYNDEVEHKMKKFQQYFKMIDVSAEKNIKDFRNEIRKFNDEFGNDADEFIK